ncbi:MAG: NAD(P)/FAD-dependent oxidoreductase [Hyphomicrobiales bacterium]
MSLPASADIVIIGAGVSGLATALPLVKAGREVLVLDKGAPWSDASGANAGTLSVQVKRREALRPTRDAIQLWERMGEDYGIDVGFVRPGGLRVATTDREVEHLRKAVGEQQGEGIEVEFLQPNALRAMAPWLGPDVKAASFCAWDAYSSPLAAGHAMIAGARALGATIEGNAAVTAIRRDRKQPHGGYVLETSKGTVRAGDVVDAAGAWAGDIAAMLEARFPVEVDVNMLTVTEPAPPLVDRVVTHAGGILSVKQYPNGTYLIGGGWQGRGSVEAGTREIDYERFIHNMRVAARVVPALAELRIVRSWAGYEAVAPDALPVMGRLAGHDRAWVLACARGGYSQAPALGARLAGMMLNRTEAGDDARFSPQRFLQ